jgi:hypothetical protein
LVTDNLDPDFLESEAKKPLKDAEDISKRNFSGEDEKKDEENKKNKVGSNMVKISNQKGRYQFTAKTPA